jgi:hypothetical protein
MGVEFEEINPNVWKPKAKDDVIEGVLINKHIDVGSNKSKTYDIETKEGQKMVWGSTILDDRMAYVKVGEVVRITFKGKETNKRSQPVNIYKVERAHQLEEQAAVAATA